MKESEFPEGKGMELHNNCFCTIQYHNVIFLEPGDVKALQTSFQRDCT